MKILVSEAEGIVLDWLIAKAKGYFSINGQKPEYWESAAGAEHFIRMHAAEGHGVHWTHGSTDWNECGPMIDNEVIVAPTRYHGCAAGNPNKWQGGSGVNWMRGPTPIIAAMRAYVAEKLCNKVVKADHEFTYDVEVPDALVAYSQKKLAPEQRQKKHDILIPVSGKSNIQPAQFIEVSAGVRYWEDATLNGREDTEGKIPLRQGDRWTPIIDLDTGHIQNWPAGAEADIHYKVCDDGEYWLLDASGKRIAKWAGDYVPNSILCIGDNGHGDYIILKVGADGAVIDWKRPAIDAGQWNPVSQKTNTPGRAP